MRFWHTLAQNRRFRIGCILVLVGAINIGANALWLHTGDIDRPNNHFAMKGGWPGFWIVSVLAVAALLAGAWLLFLEWRLRQDRNDKPRQ